MEDQMKKGRKRMEESRTARRCPVCGGPVRKPRRGPTSKFCSASCRNTNERRRRMAMKQSLGEKSMETARDLKRRSEEYAARAERIREESRRFRREGSAMTGECRLTLMTQLYIIMRNKPELIETAPTGGFVERLMQDIDECGEKGDAERMLRHQGYEGPVPSAARRNADAWR